MRFHAWAVSWPNPGAGFLLTVNVCVRRSGHTRVDATQHSAGPAGLKSQPESTRVCSRCPTFESHVPSVSRNIFTTRGAPRDARP
eukprot:2438575-Prymnesium_polylepis.1